MLRGWVSERVYEIVRDALPAVVQMHLNGVPFNKTAHAYLVEELQTELDLIKPKLIIALGLMDIHQSSGGRRNIIVNVWLN